MDSKTIIALTAVILASGCASSSSNGTGVKVEKFSISDSTLTPGQQAQIEAEIVNYHRSPSEVKSEWVSLFNTGQIEVMEKSCTPGSIGKADDGFNPKMMCTWTVQAPRESYVKGFSSKPVSVKLRMKYSASLENRKPLKISFKPVNDIEQSSTVKKTVTNGDVEVNVKTENPVALNNPQTVTVTARNIGPGNLVEDYSIEFDPSNVVENCNSPEVIQEELSKTCELNAGTEGVRNMFISTSYKYEKSPNLDIEVVNPDAR
ncbi:MAG: hypothetical protein ABEJ95_06240 [Candidatus Nanohalobium sp.]